MGSGGESSTVPAGLHEACGGMRVGAEEKVAQFVGEDVAKHFGVSKLPALGTQHKILEIDIGIDALAGGVHVSLSKGFGRNGEGVGANAYGKMRRPGECSAGGGVGRKVRGIGGATNEPIHFNARLGKDGGSAGFGAGKGGEVQVGVIEEGDLEVRRVVQCTGAGAWTGALRGRRVGVGKCRK